MQVVCAIQLRVLLTSDRILRRRVCYGFAIQGVAAAIILDEAMGETAQVIESKTVARWESVATRESGKGPVLVVDADPAIRRIVRLVLEGAGWRCFTASDAESAEQIVADERPKLVLAEVRLEGGDSGPALARRLASNGGWRPRVALMSAYPRPERGSEDYFLPKPLEFDHLIGILDSIENEPGW